MSQQVLSRSGLAECDTEPSMRGGWKLDIECLEPRVIRKSGKAQNPDISLQIFNLELQQRELLQRIEQLENLPSSFLVPINTFAPKPFEPIGQILIVVEPVLDDSSELCEYIATFVDGSVSVTGDTPEEALSLLKSRMVSQYNLLTKSPPERLGRIPQQQLAALTAVMRRIE
jgi:hypothetical protein